MNESNLRIEDGGSSVCQQLEVNWLWPAPHPSFVALCWWLAPSVFCATLTPHLCVCVCVPTKEEQGAAFAFLDPYVFFLNHILWALDIYIFNIYLFKYILNIYLK